MDHSVKFANEIERKLDPEYGLLFKCPGCKSWVPSVHIYDGFICRKLQEWTEAAIRDKINPDHF